MRQNASDKKGEGRKAREGRELKDEKQWKGSRREQEKLENPREIQMKMEDGRARNKGT